MSQGKIKTTFPPGNNGTDNGAGMIDKKDSNGNLMGPPYYVFQTPNGVPNPPVHEGDNVTFTEGAGHTATQVKLDVLPLGILDFQAIANADGSHYMYWKTQGASTARIDPGNIDVSNKLPDGNLTITNPSTTPGYTLTVYDSAGNSNSAFDNI